MTRWSPFSPVVILWRGTVGTRFISWNLSVGSGLRKFLDWNQEGNYRDTVNQFWQILFLHRSYAWRLETGAGTQQHSASATPESFTELVTPAKYCRGTKQLLKFRKTDASAGCVSVFGQFWMGYHGSVPLYIRVSWLKCFLLSSSTYLSNAVRKVYPISIFSVFNCEKTNDADSFFPPM